MHSAKLILSLALAFSLAGCGHYHKDKKHHSAGNDPLFEVEPNNDAAHADYLGEIRAGDFVAVEGHISEFGNDEYDGFAFYALEPVSVHITLHEFYSGSDLDFAIYIPEIDQVVDAWETTNHPEFGVFNFAGAGEFHIVVDAWAGDSTYLLEVDVRPLSLNLEHGPGVSERSIARFSSYGKQAKEAPAVLLEVLPQAEPSAKTR